MSCHDFSPGWAIVQTLRKLPQFGLAGEQEIVVFVKSTGLSPGRRPPSASSRLGFTWHTSPEQLEFFGILRIRHSGEGIKDQRG